MGLTRPRAYQIFDIDYKQSVRVITLSNVTLSGGAPTVVDGVTLSAGNRVLVAGQSTGSQNGLYQVSVLGTGSNGTWIRSVDGNETGEVEAGMIVMVTEGDVYKDTQWKLTTNDPIVIGVTALTFEQNSAFAFGNIYANGTAVLADIVGDTVTFTAGNNMVILANATTDTITFEVSQSPNFIGTLDANNFSISGNITGNLLPSANVTYNLGSPTQRWNEIFLAANTIDIGGATISANLTTGSLILTGPDGAEFVLTGSSPTDSFGIFGLIEAGNTEPSISTSTGALTVAGGAGIGGNLHVGEIIKATGNIEGGNLVTTGQVTAIGNVVGGNITTTGQVVATGNITGGNLSGSLITGTLTTSAQPNVTSVGTLTAVSVTGNVTGGNLITVGLASVETLLVNNNATVTGNLTVSGNVISVNVTDLNVVDPIIGLGRGANNTPLTTNDGKDRGEQLWYYTIAEQSAFIGYDNSAGKLIAATNVSVASEVVTVNNYGNFVVGGLESTTISATGNANVGNLGATTVTATALAGTLSTAAQPNVTSVGTLTSLSVTGNITGGNLTTGSQVVATGNVTGGNLTTTGQVVATGNISGSTLIAAGNIAVQSRQQVKFFDTDNSNFISIRAPNALTGDYVMTLPTGYGNADQVLSTNGAGTLTWVDQSGGGGGSSATSYPNSTVSPVPGATGNFDLSYNFVQTSQETPFESSATDAFGVNLGEVYSMMDPGGEVLEPIDLGLLT